MHRSSLAPPEHDADSHTNRSRDLVWRIVFGAIVVTFAGSQLIDFVTAQGLSSTEPKGYFAEFNPLLGQVSDPVVRQYLGFALKVAVVIFAVWVATLQRRRTVGIAILVVGTVAGAFGAWSNLNPWGW